MIPLRALALALAATATATEVPPKHNAHKNKILDEVDPTARRAAHKLNKSQHDPPPTGLEEQILYHARKIDDTDKQSLKMSQELLAKKGWCLISIHFGADHDQIGFLAYACSNPTAATSRPMRFDISKAQDDYSSLPSPPVTNVNRIFFVVGGNAMLASDFVGPVANFIDSRGSTKPQHAFFMADLPGYGSNGQKPSPSAALSVDLSAITMFKSYFPDPDLKLKKDSPRKFPKPKHFRP